MKIIPARRGTTRPTRKPIREWLEANPGWHSVSYLSVILQLDPDAVTDALGKLRRAGEVESKPNGIRKLYRLIQGSTDQSRRVGKDMEAKKERDRQYFAKKAAQLRADRQAQPPRPVACRPKLAPAKIQQPDPDPPIKVETVAEFKARGGQVETLPVLWD